MSNPDLKNAVKQIREECIKLAEFQEDQKMQKCAQVLLAASAMQMLKSKIHKNVAGGY